MGQRLQVGDARPLAMQADPVLSPEVGGHSCLHLCFAISHRPSSAACWALGGDGRGLGSLWNQNGKPGCPVLFYHHHRQADT